MECRRISAKLWINDKNSNDNDIVIGKDDNNENGNNSVNDNDEYNGFNYGWVFNENWIRPG